MKNSQQKIDAVVRKWKGSHAIEEMLYESSECQRFLLDNHAILHINKKTLTVTITQPKEKALHPNAKISGRELKEVREQLRRQQ